MTEPTEEQKKTTEEILTPSIKEETPEEEKVSGVVEVNNKIEDSDFLENAKKLKEGQENLIKEREKLESDKKEFNNIMKGQEQRGRSMAGESEPTNDERITQNAKKLVEGTGLNPFS